MTPLARSASSGLSDAIGRSDWTALLPAHRREGDSRPVGRPTCLDVLPLTDRVAVAVVEDEAGRIFPVPLVLPGDDVRRALPGDGAAEALTAALAGGSRAVGGFRLTSWHCATTGDRVTDERAITVDQTHESVVVGDAAVVKWSVPADEGPHPAPSMLTELQRSGFVGMPLPWGALEWHGESDAPPRLLALVVGYLPGAVDGWTWLVDDLREAAARADLSHVVAAGRRVGALVAAFHRALQTTARPSTPEETSGWRTGALADLDRALEVTGGRTREVLHAHAEDLREAFDSIALVAGGPVLRVHGDLHVGQVLRVGEPDRPTYALTDFDGNPVVTPTERLGEQPTALDVAQMAQSMMHAGLVVRRHHPDLDPTAVTRAADAAAEAFLASYRHGLGADTALLDERLLTPFALRQVCREFIYAATHLPRWSYVPEAALPMLLAKESA